MIEVTVRKNGIEMTGHAGQAEKGRDIVCAGASAIVWALAFGLDRIGEIDECDLGSGQARVTAMKRTGETRESGEARGMLMMAEEGLTAMAQRYPEYVTIRKIF